MATVTDLGSLDTITVKAPSPPSPVARAPAGFAVRVITLTIQLGQGSFGDSGSNTITLSGLRIMADLETVVGGAGAGAPIGAATAIIRVYGLSLSMINQLSKAGTVYLSRNNLVTLQAGDSKSGLATVFSGQFLEAAPDFGGMPVTPFVISAYTGQQLALKPVPPSSYPGTTDAGTAMGQMAKAGGMGFENNGVSVQLSSPYYRGTFGSQLGACARAANCYTAIDPATGVLAIWPKTGARGGTVPLISPATGMIAYPQFSQNRIVVRTLFNPTLKIGGQIQVQSQLTAACGVWNIIQMRHALSCQMVDGPWETVITCASIGR